jgi:TM2 domain-containing membrane protein YozV
MSFDKKKTIVCPKCSFEQEESQECMKCGVIIEKYKEIIKREKISESLSKYEELGPEQPMQEGKKPNKAVLLLLTLCFGGIGAHQFYMKKFKKGIIDYLCDCWTLLPNARSFVEFFAYLNTKTEDLQQHFRDNKIIPREKIVKGWKTYLSLFFIIFVMGIISSLDYSSEKHAQNRRDSKAKSNAKNFWANAIVEIACDSEFEYLSFSGEKSFSRENPPNGFSFDPDIEIAGELTFSKAPYLSYKDAKIKSTMNFSHKNSRNIMTLESDGHINKEIGAKEPYEFDVGPTLEYIETRIPGWVILSVSLFFIFGSPIGSLPILFYSITWFNPYI